MAESTKISGPVAIKSDSTERVAFDLMALIDHHGPANIPKDREYWIKLYSQALYAVKGYGPKQSLEHGEN